MKLKQKITVLAVISVTVIFFAVAIPLYMGLKTTGDESAKRLKDTMLFNFKENLRTQTQQIINGVKAIHKLQLQGKISETEAKTRALYLVRNSSFGKVGYFWINDITRPLPKMIMHPISPQLEGEIFDNPKYNCALGKQKNENFLKVAVDICLEKGKGYVKYLWPKPGLKKRQAKISFVHLFKDWNWIIGTGTYIYDIEQAVATVKNKLDKELAATSLTAIVIALIALIIIIIAAITIANRLSKPLQTIALRIRDIAEGEGDLTTLLNIDSKDETGEVAKWMNKFIKNIHENIIAIKKSSDSVHAASQQLLENSNVLEQMNNSTAEESAAIATATSEVSQTQQSISSAVEEMSISINEIAKQASEAANISEEAKNAGDDAQRIASELESSTKEIKKVVDFISNISSQINLLSLNAAIEAAGAGEAGKGFAVVAQEIKDLAQQTHDSLQNINEKVDDINEKGGKTVKAMANISQFIEAVNNTNSAIASSVEEQSITSREIAANLEQTNTASTEIATGIEKINNAFHEGSSAANDVKELSVNLDGHSQDLGNIVNKFKI